MTAERKLNCWEFNNCGREPGGNNIEKYGPCPAALDKRLDGYNSGTNAGRACWAVAGTLCGGAPKGLIALKLRDCMKCEFHHTVIKEENLGKRPNDSVSELLTKIRAEEIKTQHNEPSIFMHAFAKAKKAVQEEERVESLYISALIAFTSFCPNISMLQASKRLCKDDLVDELWVIDAIADDKRQRATKLFLKTVFKGISLQFSTYFNPFLHK